MCEWEIEHRDEVWRVFTKEDKHKVHRQGSLHLIYLLSPQSSHRLQSEEVVEEEELRVSNAEHHQLAGQFRHLERGEDRERGEEEGRIK